MLKRRQLVAEKDTLIHLYDLNESNETLYGNKDYKRNQDVVTDFAIKRQQIKQILSVNPNQPWLNEEANQKLHGLDQLLTQLIELAADQKHTRTIRIDEKTHPYYLKNLLVYLQKNARLFQRDKTKIIIQITGQPALTSLPDFQAWLRQLLQDEYIKPIHAFHIRDYPNMKNILPVVSECAQQLDQKEVNIEAPLSNPGLVLDWLKFAEKMNTVSYIANENKLYLLNNKSPYKFHRLKVNDLMGSFVGYIGELLNLFGLKCLLVQAKSIVSLSGETTGDLLNSLTINQPIRILELSHCSLNKKTIEILKTKLLNLKKDEFIKLKMSHIQFRETEDKVAFISLLTILMQFFKLKSLTLFACGLTDDDLQELQKYINENKFLQKLNLLGNPISAKKAESFSIQLSFGEQSIPGKIGFATDSRLQQIKITGIKKYIQLARNKTLLSVKKPLLEEADQIACSLDKNIQLQEKICKKEYSNPINEPLLELEKLLSLILPWHKKVSLQRFHLTAQSKIKFQINSLFTLFEHNVSNQVASLKKNDFIAILKVIQQFRTIHLAMPFSHSSALDNLQIKIHAHYAQYNFLEKNYVETWQQFDKVNHEKESWLIEYLLQQVTGLDKSIKSHTELNPLNYQNNPSVINDCQFLFQLFSKVVDRPNVSSFVDLPQAISQSVDILLGYVESSFMFIDKKNKYLEQLRQLYRRIDANDYKNIYNETTHLNIYKACVCAALAQSGKDRDIVEGWQKWVNNAENATGLKDQIETINAVLSGSMMSFFRCSKTNIASRRLTELVVAMETAFDKKNALLIDIYKI